MKLAITFVATTLLTGSALAAPPCRDAKGHFAKCPTATTSAGSDVTKDKNGKCHFAAGPQKGKFTKCP